MDHRSCRKGIPSITNSLAARRLHRQGRRAPSNLSASAVSSSQIDLSWSDNSSDEDYFNLESSTDGSNFTLLATLGANQTSTSDTGLAASTTYYYRVLAGNGDGESAYSNVASTTTLSAGGDPSAVDVASVAVSTVNAGKGNKQGRAVVSIVDDLGNPVSGALVDGTLHRRYQRRRLHRANGRRRNRSRSQRRALRNR